MSKTIAITGASGFLGQALADLLVAKGHRLIPLVRTGRGTFSSGQQPEQEGSKALADVDAVVHLAARLVGKEVAVSEYFEDNIALTERIARDCAEADVPRLVNISSRLVYPGTLGGRLREADADPDNPYGMSKYLGEQLVRYWANRSKTAAVSLRVSQILGPGKGSRGVIGRLCDSAVATGQVQLESDGRAIRDFVHVQDVVSAIDLALWSETVPEVLNIGSGGIPMSEVVRLVATAAGLDEGNVTLGERMDVTSWDLDCSAARSILSWVPRQQLPDFVDYRLGLAHSTESDVNR